MSTRVPPALRELAARAPTLSEEIEREYLRRIQEDDDPAAMEALCVAHLRMVLSTARRFAVPSIPIEDLVAEGNLGLTEAARRFDLSKNVRFSTYAAWWIRGLIRRYTLANRRVVGTPSTRNARRLLARLRETQRQMTAELGQPPTLEQLAQRLGVRTDEIELVEGALSGRDVAFGAQRDGRVFELPGELASPEEAVLEREHRARTAERVHEALASLGERERLIVEQRLLQPKRRTLADIGASLGVSGERVRQIEQAGRRKLRQLLAAWANPEPSSAVAVA